MIITLYRKDYATSVYLPEQVHGEYFLDEAKNGLRLSIQARENRWILQSNDRAVVLGLYHDVVKEIELKTMDLYQLLEVEHDEKACVFVEPITLDRHTYHSIDISNIQSISIGRGHDNQIVFQNPFVSSHHCRIINTGTWRVEDNNSTNGTFVNGKRTASRELKLGDVVSLMGLNLVVGKNFFSLNNPDGIVRFNLPRLHETKIVESGMHRGLHTDHEYFYMSPRFMDQIQKYVLQIDPPPPQQKKEEMPLLLIMGPSITMGMGSLAMASFAISNALKGGGISQAIPSVVMSFSMLMGMLLWPKLSRTYAEKKRIEYEKNRVDLYGTYLDEKLVAIEQIGANQKEILKANNISATECLYRISARDRLLWERSFGQKDFLELRIGLGERKLDLQIEGPKRHFTLEKDPLHERMLKICEKQYFHQNVPITIDLQEKHLQGVIGPRHKVITMAKSLLLQAVGLHSYEDLKIVILCDEDEYDRLSYLRWLPHLWDSEMRFRYVATNFEELKELSSVMDQLLDRRLEIDSRAREEDLPYYLVFCFSKVLGNRAEFLRCICGEQQNSNISALFFYDQLNDLPKDTKLVIDLNEPSNLYEKDEMNTTGKPFRQDIDFFADIEDACIKLANTKLYSSNQVNHLPSMLTFLEMYKVGKLQQLNPLSRWNENNPTQSLKAAIGVGVSGELFYLDIHEKAHGPHGLIAGMTGSGKSETIMTYILSMAINYHPNEVAFILIDYKGGGMAKTFEKLPHTAGIITNLDGAAINRSLVSIESELKRRQGIFAEAGKSVGESNLDIYKYQKLYREGRVSQPLPHLIIVADEFAELKTQQPEFMQNLISAARIGRSLGVHLILATQKPSGVVDDQIWSNSRFRICLKVQEKSDSHDMLKRHDAAEIKETGRFYLQVGFNELFELGQSAWAGAWYTPSEDFVVQKDESIDFVGRNGSILHKCSPDRSGITKSSMKQMDAITHYLATLASKEKISVRQLWLDPIPKMILVDELNHKYSSKLSLSSYQLIFGEYDDPSRQLQAPIVLDLSEDGNTVLYGSPGSGKADFLETILYQAINQFNPKTFNVYIVDLGAETLSVFRDAPHIGDVITGFNREKTENLFALLFDELARRKKYFSKNGGNFRTVSTEEMPLLTVMINNMASFQELYPEETESLMSLMRDGTNFGIQFLLTASGVNDIRFRMLQYVGKTLCLQLNDESDYAVVLGRTEGLVPSKSKGRGLFKQDGIFEFQTASISVADASAQIKTIIKEARDKWTFRAVSIPVLPDELNADFFIESGLSINLDQVPLGINPQDIRSISYNLKKSPLHLILSQTGEHQAFIREFVKLILLADEGRKHILDPSMIIGYVGEENYFTDPQGIRKAIHELFDLTVHRNNIFKDHLEKTGEQMSFSPEIYCLIDPDIILEYLSHEEQGLLALVFEKNTTAYGIHILVASDVQSYAIQSIEPLSKAIDLKQGIWVGDRLNQYYRWGSLLTGYSSEEMKDNFGYLLNGKKALKLKLVYETELEEDEFEQG